MASICMDTFLLRVAGARLERACTLVVASNDKQLPTADPGQSYKDGDDFTVAFKYTMGDDVNPSHPNYGFSARFAPSRAGLGASGSFDRAPVNDGNAIAEKSANYNGSVSVASDVPAEVFTINGTIILNTGTSAS